nr:hypothetical protein [Sneathiella glossodoripedis]
MFTKFFFTLREAKLPVTLREYLTLIEALKEGVAGYSVNDFYYLARTTLVKDEKNLDKFDQVFGHCFNGIEFISDDQTVEIPEEWLRKLAELSLTDEEKARSKPRWMGKIDGDVAGTSQRAGKTASGR